jgi:hypothetical protein
VNNFVYLLKNWDFKVCKIIILSHVLIVTEFGFSERKRN